ncbi:hypothetical protein PHIM7_56 [Sinorhizobium phage phiM7]|uniref:Uncharacterized protein n=3 Tax=Emdodecavirus TaxID=1980937 RepID=S5MAR5_9CAUD|nr:hypothetical protein AB690_gp063 [Sinorhizobium phage phiM12]YP_009212312.1 hypothetical protein AVT40_gp072 [Sinorhizobium phage phiN3]YP_009601181.1 hypothetical protein FDH46_gp056 [Sinorhizobium phage phiM7]AKF12964.1 hypothetical protein PHIM19_57 [Sinorhizobium phage phiM19]AGR47708.1 hypothetical protein SmphiM12_076 [Sinorhizobium phage phiM12]AKF12604.1 hypothetical protein PHIM7_56 [Sinorhizobium phage phiM7]AKF13337.1 hypothetical protein PHIN3_72 [Sinorhizobium phage phiN3]
MKRPVNPQIFGFLNLLFAAEKKFAKRLRRDLVAGRIDTTQFDLKRNARNKAFDRRYDTIYRKFA